MTSLISLIRWFHGPDRAMEQKCNKIMWKEVKKNSIKFSFKHRDKNNIPTPIPRNSLEISNGLKMLEYIFEEDQNNFFPEDVDFFNFDFNNDGKKGIGFLVRINAYVNILCNLEKIVEKTHDELRTSIKNLGYKRSLPKKVENKLKERKKEIENFLFWRNKVFAHTAYTNPNKYLFSSKLMKDLGICEECMGKLKENNKKDIENDSTQLTALAYFGGMILGHGKRSFQIGGVGITLTTSNREIKSRSFPVIDIAENHSNVIEHFKKWEEMFIETLEKFKTIDKKDIMKKNKNIKEIIYSSWICHS